MTLNCAIGLNQKWKLISLNVAGAVCEAVMPCTDAVASPVLLWDDALVHGLLGAEGGRRDSQDGTWLLPCRVKGDHLTFRRLSTELKSSE